MNIPREMTIPQGWSWKERYDDFRLVHTDFKAFNFVLGLEIPMIFYDYQLERTYLHSTGDHYLSVIYMIGEE